MGFMSSPVAVYDLEKLAKSSEEILTSSIGGYLGSALLSDQKILKNWEESIREARYRSIKSQLEGVVNTTDRAELESRIIELLMNEAFSYLGYSNPLERRRFRWLYLDVQRLEKAIDESNVKQR